MWCPYRIFSQEVLFVLGYMLNVIMNQYATSISKTMHSNLKESSVAGLCTCVEQANEFPSTTVRMFRIFGLGSINRAERRKVKAFANMMMMMSSSLWWKMMHAVAHAEKTLV